MRKNIVIIVALLVTLAVKQVDAQSFVHPGLLHSREDLMRMKNGVAATQVPIITGFEVFAKNPQSQLSYIMQGPMMSVGRNPTVGQGVYDSDANAAYQCALMWCITGEIAYADKAKEIVNAWSKSLKSITGKDAVLMAGLGPFKMVNAAELLRYTDAGWTANDIKQCETHFKEVIYPVIRDFAPFANGNWDAAAVQTVMAIGIFCNDGEIFERALDYYINGWGDGCLTNYIINDNGQIQESGRDQQHTQLGLGLLSECCEMAWHQGLDLYAYANNRLLKGFEYTAKYNLGIEVPFTPTTDRTGKYIHKAISEAGRGQLRPVYEQIYNHYVNRMGMQAPFTKLAAEKIRPEEQGRPGADHPGFGTLFYTRPAVNGSQTAEDIIPLAPAGIIAKGSNKVMLTWIAAINAKSYTIKRATRINGPFTVVEKNIRQPLYTDLKVRPGTLYYYTISSSNATGESPDSYKTSVYAGLPAPWTHQDVGDTDVAGDVVCNASVFRMEGSGSDTAGIIGGFHFLFSPVKGDGSVTARFIPQVSSQFSKMGLTMRESTMGTSRHVSLIMGTQPSGSIEAPGWRVQLITRDTSGGYTHLEKESANFSEPVVTNGRLTGYYRLKLERKGNIFTGFISTDDITWSELGSITVPLAKDLLSGIAVSSGLSSVSTTVRADNLIITK